MLHVFGITIQALFPASIAVTVLIATLVLAGLVIIIPVRRATRLNPGDAIRYL
jgi:ABC-type antimicrobial peptide transport system permease subunit